MRIYIIVLLSVFMLAACNLEENKLEKTNEVKQVFDINYDWLLKGFKNTDGERNDKLKLNSLLSREFISGTLTVLMNTKKVKIRNCADLLAYDMQDIDTLHEHDRQVVYIQKMRCVTIHHISLKTSPAPMVNVDYIGDVVFDVSFFNLYRKSADEASDRHRIYILPDDIKLAVSKSCDSKWSCYAEYEDGIIGIDYLYKRDINADGIMDMVVFIQEKYKNGTGGLSTIVVFTKTDNSASYKIIDVIDK